RYCTALTPFAIDIASFVFVTDELAVAIDAPIGCIYVVTLLRSARFCWRCDLLRIRILIQLQTSKCQVRICDKSEPRYAKGSEYSEKQFHELIQATLTSGRDSFEDSAAGSCGRTRVGSSRISFTAAAKLMLATKMSRTATFCTSKNG